jgi:hypothetical protein
MKLCSKLQVSYEYGLADYDAMHFGTTVGIYPAVYTDLHKLMKTINGVLVDEICHWKLDEKTLTRRTRPALCLLNKYYGLYKADLLMYYSSETLSITMYFANENINVTELLTAFEDQNAHKLSFDPVRTWIS